MAQKKVGVLLSGCGVFDGSEIHEAVITLLALARMGAQAVCMAPNVEQLHVIDHLTQQPTNEKRIVNSSKTKMYLIDLGSSVSLSLIVFNTLNSALIFLILFERPFFSDIPTP